MAMRGNKLYYESDGSFDVLDFIQAFNLSFSRGNVVKYVCRAGKKDDELQDLYKAKDYIEREIAYVKAKRQEESNKWTSDATT
jgi:hypothetical protein